MPTPAHASAPAHSPEQLAALSVTGEDVRRAAERLRAHVENTPCLHSRTLSEITGAEVYLKFENLQFTSSLQGARRAQQAVVADRRAEARRA